jgi:hypothetical protein
LDKSTTQTKLSIGEKLKRKTEKCSSDDNESCFLSHGLSVARKNPKFNRIFTKNL